MTLKPILVSVGTSLISVAVLHYLSPALTPYAFAVWATLATIFITNNVSLVKKVITRA